MGVSMIARIPAAAAARARRTQLSSTPNRIPQPLPSPGRHPTIRPCRRHRPCHHYRIHQLHPTSDTARRSVQRRSPSKWPGPRLRGPSPAPRRRPSRPWSMCSASSAAGALAGCNAWRRGARHQSQSRWFSRAEPEPSAPNYEEMYNQIAAWYNEPESRVARKMGPVSGPRRITDVARLRPGHQRVP
jgi:hypothetical protein